MAKRVDLSSRTYGDIAERLRWHVALEGGDQEEYAKRAGLKRQQVSNWLTGKGRVSVDGALALHKTYGLSLDWIYLGDAETLPRTLRQAWYERDRPE